MVAGRNTESKPHPVMFGLSDTFREFETALRSNMLPSDASEHISSDRPGLGGALPI